jgi:hypothetical protein
VLPSFLEAVSNLPLDNQMVPEIRELRETLANIFYFSMEFENDESHDRMLLLYQNFGLIKYVEAYELELRAVI